MTISADDCTQCKQLLKHHKILATKDGGLKTMCPLPGEIIEGPRLEGLRFDDGKPRVDLLPPDALMELGKVYAYGATKYAENNWLLGMKWSRVLGPLLRHTFYWMMGKTRDRESGCHHMAHVAWNAIALFVYQTRGIGTDDRYSVGADDDSNSGANVG